MRNRAMLLFVMLGLCIVGTQAQIQSNGTGGGDWNTGSTWIGGAVPGAGDNVVIQGSDVVTLAAAGTCADLTMNAGTKLTIGAFALPGSSWSLNVASTVEWTAVPSSWVNATFGNLIYGGANYSLTQNLNVLGDLTVTTATLRGIGTTSGSLTHSVAGNVIIGPGTGARISCVNQSSATTASCTWNIGGNVSLTGNNSGNRLIIFESAGPHSSPGAVNINGNLNIGSTSQVQVRSSTTANTSTCTGTVTVKGNISNSGTIATSSGATGTSFVFTMNGTSAQQFTGIFPNNFPAGQTAELRIDNAAGVSLGTLATVGTGVTLTLVNGLLTTTGATLLTIGANGTISGGSSSSFVNGPMAQTVTTTSSTAKTFLVGKGTAYRPVTLTVTQDAATATIYTAEVFNVAPASRTLAGSLDRVSVIRYWNIVKGAGANVTTASVNLAYDADDGVSDAANLRIAKDDGAGSWVDLGGTGTAPTTGTITSTNNFTTFSDFTLANNTGGGNPLPIQLASFTARMLSTTSVRLDWETISEINNYGFEVQRSLQPTNGFQSISTLIPGNGTTNERHFYSYTDNTASVGQWFYRLKQIDLDGTVYFTEPVQVDVLTAVTETAPLQFVLSQNYPNPFNPSTNIKFSVEKTAMATLEVFNMLGQKVLTLFDETAEAGKFYTVKLNAEHLSSGMYLYRLESNNKSEMKKMLLLK